MRGYATVAALARFPLSLGLRVRRQVGFPSGRAYPSREIREVDIKGDADAALVAGVNRDRMD